MSPVTGLAVLTRRILLSVHMGHFSPVDLDEIQESKPNGETCIVRDCCKFVDSCNFTNKANSHAFEVEIHTRQKLCHFGRYDAKAELFCQKSFVVSYDSVNWRTSIKIFICHERCRYTNSRVFIMILSLTGKNLHKHTSTVSTAHVI